MKRFTLVRSVQAALAIAGILMSGCSNRIAMELRDAAVSGAAGFVEQQTGDLLLGLLGTGSEE